ncbi:MAG: hypothetical protein KDD42_03755 [Bdellovibrionales bacterium]|nr:hypothetical protein [Bdellovibrionales bacterium]
MRAGFINVLLIGFAALNASFLGGQVACAQQQPFDPRAIDSSALSEAYLLEMGIPQDSKFYKPLKSKLVASLNQAKRAKYKEIRDGGAKQDPSDQQDQEEQQSARPSKTVINNDNEVPLPELAVIRHYRGENGIPLPEPSEIYNPFDFSREQFFEMVEKYKPVMEQTTKALFQAGALPSCAGSTTDKEKLDLRGIKGKLKSEVLFDTIYISEEQLGDHSPSDFGERTEIIVYRAGSQEPASLFARQVGVDCLPFRVRITPLYRFIHKGSDALLNFDQHPNKKGKDPEKVKKKRKK